MALQSSGSISLSQINTELGRSSNAQISISNAENGSIVALNACSSFKPVAGNPAKASEWYSYNHTQPCVYQFCAGYSDTSKTEVCNNTSACDSGPVFSNHDYVIIRFNWVSGSGSDLDVLCGFTNTGQSVDSDWVGYGEGAAVPLNSSVSNAYVFWNSDNTGSLGLEAVSVNYTKLLTDYTGITVNPIRFRLNAWWFGTKGTGDITVEFLTYTGGNPVTGNQYNMLPGSGSTLKDRVVYSTNISATRASTGGALMSTTNSTTIGYINYNKTTKTAYFTTT